MNLFQNISKWFKIKIFSQSENSQNNKEYKLLILGEKCVGKTSLCNRFLNNEFNLEIKPTTQSECFMKEINLLEHIINLYIIDISENILSTDRSHLYSNVSGALILYDITKSKSFDEIEKWLIDLKQNTNNDLPILIVGNKSDLNFLRNVDSEEGSQKAMSYNCDFCETSCVEEKSVQEAFKFLIAKIFYNEMPTEQKNMFKVSLYQNLNQEENKIDEVDDNGSFHLNQEGSNETIEYNEYFKSSLSEEKDIKINQNDVVTPNKLFIESQNIYQIQKIELSDKDNEMIQNDK